MGICVHTYVLLAVSVILIVSLIVTPYSCCTLYTESCTVIVPLTALCRLVHLQQEPRICKRQTLGLGWRCSGAGRQLV